MNRSNCHSLLRHCETLRQLQQAHAQAITQGLHPRFQPLSCAILNSYARLGRAADAKNVFLQIPSPDLVSLTSLMSLQLRSDNAPEAILVFSEIVVSGRQPDGFTIVGALTASGHTGNAVLGKAVHAMVYRYRLGYEAVVGNALVGMYCKIGKIRLARLVFDGMVIRDAISWSTMLHGYVKCLGLESAGQFFYEMPKRDAVSWTVMITGHVQGKLPVRALELFRQMKSEGHHPSLITVVGVLSACADIGALDLGCAIHGYINKLNVSCDITVYNALIDMYSKSGSVEMANEIFEGMAERDVYTWTTMISGFAVHGDGIRALNLFSEMLELDVVPNEVTFVAVLSACCHAGLVDEGRTWFERMRRFHNFKPQLVHYGCMVDLLGRAGLLREAEILIKEMDVNPDGVIWRSLLSACLVHGDVRLAEIAGEEIIKQEPNDDGVYVLLWNMYASSNKWEKALETRQKMRSMKVLKKPGCSWIEVDGLVHEFLVEDKIHFLQNEIYHVLEVIVKQLKTINTLTFLEEDFLIGNEG